MRTVLTLLVIGFLFNNTASSLDAPVTVVVPNELEDREGTGAGSSGLEGRGFRYQQILPASEFGDLPGAMLLTRIAYRADGVLGHDEPIDYEDLEVYISTTSVGAGGLSPVFDENHGADRQLVYKGSWTSQATVTGPPGGPHDFSRVLELERPFFLYDPFEENLIIELLSNSGYDRSPRMDRDGGLLGLTAILGCPASERVSCPDCGNPNERPDSCRVGGSVMQLTFIPESPDPVGSIFLRGDCNADGEVNISDATCALNWLFAGVAAPGCLAALNTNGDDKVDIADPVSLLNSLFGGGPAPVAPFPDCGPGTLPADAGLGCENPQDCQ